MDDGTSIDITSAYKVSATRRWTIFEYQSIFHLPSWSVRHMKWDCCRGSSAFNRMWNRTKRFQRKTFHQHHYGYATHLATPDFEEYDGEKKNDNSSRSLFFSLSRRSLHYIFFPSLPAQHIVFDTQSSLAAFQTFINRHNVSAGNNKRDCFMPLRVRFFSLHLSVAAFGSRFSVCPMRCVQGPTLHFELNR